MSRIEDEKRFWHNRAAEARITADASADAKLKEAMLDLAEQYDEIAESQDCGEVGVGSE